MLTLDDLKQAMPVQFKNAATVALLDKVNGVHGDPEFAQVVRDNFVSYASVLADGRFKIDDYLNACTYVSLKMMNFTNQRAYEHTFPKRYQTLVAAGRTKKEISAYVANYNKNKLVNLVLEQSIIPSWIMNQDVYQKAINTQLKLMMTANSEKVRTDAANSILTHLKKPESKKVELEISAKDNSGLEQLKATMTALAEQQISMIQGGTSTRAVAHQKLVDITPEEE